jgi:hypothetical protein
MPAGSATEYQDRVSALAVQATSDERCCEMGSTHASRKAILQESTIRYRDDVPNFPEVSGTSFPLLTTVLTGFAVTIVVQLLLREDSGDLSGSVALSIGAFLLSALALIVSTVCAISAQARNHLSFLDLNDISKELLGIRDVHQWVRCLERQWYIYH